jgi:hypothetical protein
MTLDLAKDVQYGWHEEDDADCIWESVYADATFR